MTVSGGEVASSAGGGDVQEEKPDHIEIASVLHSVSEREPCARHCALSDSFAEKIDHHEVG